MEINLLFDEGFEDCLPAPVLTRIASATLDSERKIAAEMGILITGDAHIQALNASYRQIDRPTDVLSFAMQESVAGSDAFPAPPDGLEHLGEVIINYPQAARQAHENGHSVLTESAMLLVHGILHLLGYDHDTSEKENAMTRRTRDIIDSQKEALG